MKNLLPRLFCLRFLGNFPRVIVIPFFAFWLINIGKMSPAHAGIVVGSYLITYRTGALIFSGLLIKHNLKWILISALILSALFQSIFYSFDFFHVHNYFWWAVNSLLLGATTSIVTNCILSYIGSAVDKEHHAAYFSYLSMALNLSSGLGPVFGGIILHQFSQYLFLIPSLFSLFTVVLGFYLPSLEIEKPSNDASPVILKLFSEISLLKFVLLSSLSAFGYACFYDLFPLYGHHFLSLHTISLLFLTTCFIIFMFQLPVKKIILNGLKINMALFIANVLLALSVGLLFLGNKWGLVSVFLGAIFLSFAEMIFVPLYQTKTLLLAKSLNHFRAMALYSACWGMMESLAATLGTYFIAHQFSFLFYMSCASLSLISAICFLKLI